MNRIKAKDVFVIVCKPTLDCGSLFYGSAVNLDEFIMRRTLPIIANRMSIELENIEDALYK